MRTIAFLLLWLYAFTLPWDYILEFGEPIGSAGRVAGLLALAGYFVLVGTTGRIRRPQALHVCALLYLSIVVLSLFWTVDTPNSLVAIRTYVQGIMIVWVLWEVGISLNHLFHLATAYVAGAYIGALSIFHSFSLATVVAHSREARFTADSWNANDIALALALAIPLAFYVASEGDHWTVTLLARGYLIVGPMAILLTSSRGGATVMAIAFCGLPFFMKSQTATAKLVTITALTCALLLAWTYAPAQSWDRVSSTFASLAAGDLNGREQIWQSALAVFDHNYLVGVGAGAFHAALGGPSSGHNTYLIVLLEQGILGFSVFTFILGCTIYSTRRLTGNQRKGCLLLLLCWGVGTFSLGWAGNRITWFVLGLVFCFGSVQEHLQLSESEISSCVTSLAEAI